LTHRLARPPPGRLAWGSLPLSDGPTDGVGPAHAGRRGRADKVVTHLHRPVHGQPAHARGGRPWRRLPGRLRRLARGCGQVAHDGCARAALAAAAADAHLLRRTERPLFCSWCGERGPHSAAVLCEWSLACLKQGSHGLIKGAWIKAWPSDIKRCPSAQPRLAGGALSAQAAWQRRSGVG